MVGDLDVNCKMNYFKQIKKLNFIKKKLIKTYYVFICLFF